MIGFFIGTVCLIGLIKTVRHGRRGGCHGGHRGWRGGFGGGRGRRGAARFLFEILDATPGQEKVILGVMDDVRTAGDEAKKQWKAARTEAAQAIRGDALDEGALREASVKLDGAGQVLRDAITHGLGTIHAVLEPDQRRRLAELIDDGPGFFDRFSGGPYRRGWQG